MSPISVPKLNIIISINTSKALGSSIVTEFEEVQEGKPMSKESMGLMRALERVILRMWNVKIKDS